MADDQKKVREALRLMLEVATDWVIMDEVANSSLLLAQMKRNCPDMVLLEWNLPGAGPVALIAELRKMYPKVKIIVYTGQVGMKAAALDVGADAFVSKTENPDKLLAILRMETIPGGGRPMKPRTS